ncbi:hypothetical protein [Xanthomonas translucens]|uniref:hypothetical protein n=1 Tax=Xanthomonas campestris pv. translucens TaxID=343 RepID=UPI000A44D976|nr:hypothetical protein [Xanthomonas translucens]
MGIAKNLMRALKGAHLGSLTEGVVEAILDVGLEDGMLKEIPVVSSVLGVGRSFLDIRDRIFIEKVEIFIGAVANLTWAERSRMVDELAGSDELQERVGLAILDILEKSDPIDKPRLIGNLFVAMGRGHILGKDILRLSTMIAGVFVDDLERLAERHRPDDIEEGRRFALQANGFLISKIGTLYASGEGTELNWEVSGDGRMILKHCFEPAPEPLAAFADTVVY